MKKRRFYPEDTDPRFAQELARRREEAAEAAAKARRFDRVVLEVKAEALDREQRVERARRAKQKALAQAVMELRCLSVSG